VAYEDHGLTDYVLLKRSGWKCSIQNLELAQSLLTISEQPAKDLVHVKLILVVM
jgi:hypothetical protein